jgi:hypothetical protein
MYTLKYFCKWWQSTTLIYDYGMSDSRYRRKVYSNLRYNVGLRSLHFNIESSDISSVNIADHGHQIKRPPMISIHTHTYIYVYISKLHIQALCRYSKRKAVRDKRTTKLQYIVYSVLYSAGAHGYIKKEN